MIHRSIAVVLIVAALGLPIVDSYTYGLFLAGLFCAAFFEPSRRPWRSLMAAGIAAVAVVAQSALPRAAIEEGHNVYLRLVPAGIYEAELPAAVVTELATAFEARYPPERWCTSQAGCWRNQNRWPAQSFAFSADSVWRPAKYSRVVDRIDFDDLRSFRGGFVNEKMFNWYDGRSDVKRGQMPFFVMYELSAASVGSRLCWRGVMFWPSESGELDRIAHPRRACRPIAEADAGQRVYGVAVSYDPPLAIRLDPSATLWWSAVVEDLVKAVAVLGIVLSMFVPGIEGERRRTVAVVAAGAALVVAIELLDGNAIGGWWPYAGGNDGLTHESYGHVVLRAVLNGDWAEALRGNESVYWHMPGLRYVRALGSIFFGDTSFGFLTVVLTVPAAFYLLCRTVLPIRAALILSGVFLALPIWSPFGLSFFSYVDLYQRGLGEGIAYTAFFFALAIYLHAARQGVDDMLRSAIWANLLLVVALFIRPNLGPGTIVFLLCIFLFMAGRAQKMQLACAAVAFLPLLLIPLHNLHFGGVFVPTTTSALHESNLHAPPALYLAAISELLSGDRSAGNLERIGEHLFRWLHISGSSDSWYGIIQNGLAFAGVVAALIVPQLSDRTVRVLAATALVNHGVLFFWEPNRRYAMVAWTLSYIVSVAVLHRWWMRRRHGDKLANEITGAVAGN